MNRKTAVRLVGLAGIIFLIAWWMHFCSPEVQAPRTFARIVAGVKHLDAGEVLAQIHPDYDFKNNFPEEFGDIAGAYPPRLVARQALDSVFKEYERDPPGCKLDIERIEAHDGVVDVWVSLNFVSALGKTSLSDRAPITNHKFTLAADSWISPRLYIRGHDPIHVYE